ncbi:MAG: hypothetical protein FWG15_00895 [Propionibacteriaceae bacterium]|nr:hypothetical protein [Propionibacteriaceae bacterium]
MATFRGQVKRHQSEFLIYCIVIAIIAIASGIIWNRIVTLPAYQIADDFRASIPQSALAQAAGTDVVFCIIGALSGLIVGVAAWILFKNLASGILTFLGGVGSLLAGVLARITGEFIGPRDFEQRIASAAQGDVVSIDFAGGTWVPLAIWVGMAMVPIIIGLLGYRQRWFTHVPVGDISPVETDQVG